MDIRDAISELEQKSKNAKIQYFNSLRCLATSSHELSVTSIIQYVLSNQAVSHHYSNYIQNMPFKIVSLAATIVQQRLAIHDMNTKASKLLEEKLKVIIF